MTIIDQTGRRTKQKILDAAMLPIRMLLPNALLEAWCAELKHVWRERTFGPIVTLLACVWKHMQPNVVSARDVEDGVGEWNQDAAMHERSGSDFCQARQRVPLALFQRSLEHVGRLASQSGARMYRGLRLWIVDGSSMRVPNTKELDEHYGRSGAKSRLSKTPLMRLLILICAGSLAVLKVVTGAYRDSEQAMFLRLLQSLPAGGLIVADRAYGSFLQCCRVQIQGSHLLARLRTDRKGKKIKGLGHRDKLVEWNRPKPKDSAFPEGLADCPPKIYVRVIERSMRRRGYRTWTLVLVTTLLDPNVYPASELVELYMQRWDIETVLRTLKTHYGMDRASAKSPDVVEKEMCSTVLAYNCVVALMCQSGEASELISPLRARNIVMRYCHYMSHAPTIRLMEMFKLMLQQIATALQLPQERLPQPRCILRHKTNYPLLRGSRDDWRRKYLAA